MMRLVIFGAVAFLLGTGGTTGVMVMTAPVPAAADSAAAHGGDAHGKPAAGEHGAAAHGDSAVAHAAPAPDAHAGEPAAGHEPDAHTAAAQPAETVVPPAPTGVHEGRPTRQPDAESYKSVGNILMNMKPVEAAKILAYLSDAQVEGLLRSMSPRNAATILSQLPSERAAALSKRLLVPAEKDGQP
jgi:hypothetical protein